MKKIVCTLIASLMLPLAAWGGIATPTADMVVTNLRIGGTYDLTKIAGMPFKVQAKGGSYRIKVELLRPDEGRTVDGYEPVPDLSWITLGKTDHMLLSGETGLTDITISIPDDAALLGKKFEAKIHAYTVPADGQQEGVLGVGMGVVGSLRFSVAPLVPSTEERNQFEKIKFSAPEFNLVPGDLWIKDVPMGTVVNTERSGQVLKLINLGEKSQKVNLTVIPVSGTGLTFPEGYEEAPASITTFLVLPKMVTLGAMKILKIPLKIYIPDNQMYEGKRYMFVVDATVNGDVVSTTYRSKIYVTVQSKKP